MYYWFSKCSLLFIYCYSSRNSVVRVPHKQRFVLLLYGFTLLSSLLLLSFSFWCPFSGAAVFVLEVADLNAGMTLRYKTFFYFLLWQSGFCSRHADLYSGLTEGFSQFLGSVSTLFSSWGSLALKELI